MNLLKPQTIKTMPSYREHLAQKIQIQRTHSEPLEKQDSLQLKIQLENKYKMQPKVPQIQMEQNFLYSVPENSPRLDPKKYNQKFKESLQEVFELLGQKSEHDPFEPMFLDQGDNSKRPKEKYKQKRVRNSQFNSDNRTQRYEKQKQPYIQDKYRMSENYYEQQYDNQRQSYEKRENYQSYQEHKKFEHEKREREEYNRHQDSYERDRQQHFEQKRRQKLEKLENERQEREKLRIQRESLSKQEIYHQEQYMHKQQENQIKSYDIEEIEKMEMERLQKIEQEKREKERLEKAEQMEMERLQKIEQEKRERELQEKAEQMEKERLQKIEQEKREKERKEKAEQMEMERLQKIEQEKRERERQEQIKRMEMERVQKIEQEKKERERQEQAEKEKREKERQEQAEQIKKQEADRAQKEKLEQERLEKAYKNRQQLDDQEKTFKKHHQQAPKENQDHVLKQDELQKQEQMTNDQQINQIPSKEQEALEKQKKDQQDQYQSEQEKFSQIKNDKDNLAQKYFQSQNVDQPRNYHSKINQYHGETQNRDNLNYQQQHQQRNNYESKYYSEKRENQYNEQYQKDFKYQSRQKEDFHYHQQSQISQKYKPWQERSEKESFGKQKFDSQRSERNSRDFNERYDRNRNEKYEKYKNEKERYGQNESKISKELEPNDNDIQTEIPKQQNQRKEEEEQKSNLEDKNISNQPCSIKPTSSIILQILQRLDLTPNYDIFIDVQNRKKKTQYLPKEKQSQHQIEFRRSDPVQSKNDFRQPVDELKKKIANQSNQWVLHHTQNDSDKQIEKEIRVNLNKLTPENFDVLKPILVKFGGVTKFACEQLIQMIIEKSQQEQKYASLYAQLCCYLRDKIKFDSEPPRGFLYHTLISKIQDSFNQLQNEIVQCQPNKKKLIGNINFIAELFISGALKVKIISNAANELFQNFFISYYDKNEHSEVILEALIKLFDRVGFKLESSKEQKDYGVDVEKILQDIELLRTLDYQIIKDISIQAILQIFEQIIQHLDISVRLKSLVQNLQQRRNEHWRESIVSKDAPQKLSDIRDELDNQVISERRQSDYTHDKRNHPGNQKYRKSSYLKHEKREKKSYEKPEQPPFEQTEGDIKDLFKTKNYEEIASVYQKSNVEHFFNAFLLHFWNHTKDEVTKILSIFSEIGTNINSEICVRHLNNFLCQQAWQEDSPLLSTHLVAFCGCLDKTILFNKICLDILDHKKDLDETLIRVEFYLKFLQDFIKSDKFDPRSSKMFVTEQAKFIRDQINDHNQEDLLFMIEDFQNSYLN